MAYFIFKYLINADDGLETKCYFFVAIAFLAMLIENKLCSITLHYCIRSWKIFMFLIAQIIQIHRNNVSQCQYSVASKIPKY